MPRNTLGPVKCRATNKQGERCNSWAIRGGTVCGQHGGRAPQVRRKAEERIRELVNPALARIAKLIGDDELPGAESEAVSLAAARDILDRAGYGATAKVSLEADVTVRSPIDDELDRLAEKLCEHDRKEQTT